MNVSPYYEEHVQSRPHVFLYAFWRCNQYIESLNVAEDLPQVRNGLKSFISKKYLQRKMEKIFGRFEELPTRLRQRLVSKVRTFQTRLHRQQQPPNPPPMPGDQDLSQDLYFNILFSDLNKVDFAGVRLIEEDEAQEYIDMIVKVVGKIEAQEFNPKGFCTPLSLPFKI